MLSFAIDSVIERLDGFGGRGKDESIMKYSLAEQPLLAGRTSFDRRAGVLGDAGVDRPCRVRHEHDPRR